MRQVGFLHFVYFFIQNDKYILHYVEYIYIINVTNKEVVLMSFFKRNKNEDEWLVQTRNKIYAEIYVLILIITVISLIIKSIVYGFGFTNVLTELIILLTMGIYYAYRSIYLGVHAAEIEMKERERKWSSQKRNIIYALLIGFGVAIAMGLNSAIQYADGFLQSIWYFSLTSIVSLMIYLPLSLLFIVIGNEMIKRKSKKVADEMLNGDENEKS